MTRKLFCPLMSTNAQKVYCNENCMWYVYNDDDASGVTCAVALNLHTNGYILTAIENLKSKG